MSPGQSNDLQRVTSSSRQAAGRDLVTAVSYIELSSLVGAVM